MILVRTPTPVEFESLAGFLLRVTEENGYPNPYMFLGRYSWKSSGVYYLTSEEISERTGIASSHLMGIANSKRKSSRFTNFGGVRVLTEHLDLVSVPVCIYCLEEGLPHLALFHVKWIEACPIHGNKLIYRCPSCHASLTVRRPSLRMCRCGADISLARSLGTPSQDYLAIARVLKISFYRESKDALDVSYSHMEGVSVSSLLVLLQALENFVREPRQPSIPKSPINSNGFDPKPAVAWLLASWPKNFHIYLESRYGVFFRTLDPYDVFNSVVFRWVSFLRIKLTNRLSEALFFITALVDFGSKYVDRRRISRLIADPRVNSDWRTLSSLSKDAEHLRSLLQLLKQNGVHISHSPSEDKELIVFNADLYSWPPTEAPSDVSLRLGAFCRHAIARLRKEKILVHSGGNTGRSFFCTHVDIDRCLELIVDALTNIPQRRDLLHAHNDRTLAMLLRGESLSDIIDAVLQRREEIRRELQEQIVLVHRTSQDPRMHGPRLTWHSLLGVRRTSQSANMDEQPEQPEQPTSRMTDFNDADSAAN